MSGRAPLRIGIIGLGFMGQIHLRAYIAAQAAGFPCRIGALCDTDRARAAAAAASLAHDARGSGPRIHDDAMALIADDSVDIVSVCTPTDSHASLAIAAARAGMHALVEKPVGLRAADVRPVADAARAADGVICMPAMCVRYWPGWDWLAARVRDGALGAVRSAAFQRLGARPTWGAGFYDDHARSGGALIDFHIHDADMALRLFGRPASVSCAGSLEHVTTQYRFENGPAHVTAEAGWTLAPGAPFRMRYLVSFERATAEFELGREPALRVYAGVGAPPTDIALPPISGYDGEIRALLRETLHQSGRGAEAPLPDPDGPDSLPTMDEALEVALLLDAERQSLERAQWVRL